LQGLSSNMRCAAFLATVAKNAAAKRLLASTSSRSKALAVPYSGEGAAE
jgi:hypothetical protein